MTWRRVLLTVLCVAPARAGNAIELQDQHPPQARPPEPRSVDVTPARNLPRCGLGAAFHGGRRAKLLEELHKRNEVGVVLVRGLPETRDYARFSQDKTFWYLTGVESPSAAFVMDVKSGAQILFLPRSNAASELWEGELWDAGDAWVRDVSGFEDVRPIDELVSVLKNATRDSKLVFVSKTPWVALSGCQDRASQSDSAQHRDPLDGRPSREEALEEALHDRLAVEVRDFAPILAEMRRIKTPEEIAALRRAADAGAKAMIEAIRSSRPGLLEQDLEAVMTYVQRCEGATGPAYMAIIGSGPNALALHYSALTREMKAGEMLLDDYAPEFDHYTSDITRSWPVDGVFTPRMIEIYDTVLESQLAGIAEVRPSRTMADVERACRKVLSKHGMGKLLPHGTCHYVGLEVHDASDNGKPFVPGVVITVEPGVYDTQAGIGVRIEDVVVVTETGCDVITAGVPKDRAALTRLVAEEGLLDRFSIPSRLPPVTAVTPPPVHEGPR